MQPYSTKMAAQRGANGVEKKKRSKKRRTRTEVSSSSESDSDSNVSSGKVARVEDDASDASPAPVVAKKEKKKKATAQQDDDVVMEDAPASPSQPAKSTCKSGNQAQEDFGALYLRKIASEFADDLDKVREAQDFKASSVPMLIHALKQGESLFTAEEKRRVVAATKA